LTHGICEEISLHDELLSISKQTCKWRKMLFFPSPGPYHSQQFYHPCFLWFKIITMTIFTDNGEGPNIRGGKGASKAAPLYHKVSFVRLQIN